MNRTLVSKLNKNTFIRPVRRRQDCCIFNIFFQKNVLVFHSTSPFVEDKVVGQALFRSYGCFFAEFLGDLSLVRLSLLDLTTCVGLRYGSHMIMLGTFSWRRALYYPLWRTAGFSGSLVISIKSTCGFTYMSTSK